MGRNGAKAPDALTQTLYHVVSTCAARNRNSLADIHAELTRIREYRSFPKPRMLRALQRMEHQGLLTTIMRPDEQEQPRLTYRIGLTPLSSLSDANPI